MHALFHEKSRSCSAAICDLFPPPCRDPDVAIGDDDGGDGDDNGCQNVKKRAGGGSAQGNVFVDSLEGQMDKNHRRFVTVPCARMCGGGGRLCGFVQQLNNQDPAALWAGWLLGVGNCAEAVLSKIAPAVRSARVAQRN